MNNIISHSKSIAEFGGPSPLFNSIFPVYSLFKDIDGYNLFDNNYWQKEFKENYIGNGRQYNCDVVSISIDKKYDLILNSHVVEHIANPLKALINWSKILNPGGYVLSVIPDKSMMFDCKRPLTTMSHLASDLINKVEEDDETHIKEALELFTNNGGYDYDNYLKSSRNNKLYRAIHHHCFDIKLIKNMFEFCQYKVIYQEQKDMHILTIAKYE